MALHRTEDSRIFPHFHALNHESGSIEIKAEDVFNAVLYAFIVLFALLLVGGSVLLTGHMALGLAVGLATLVTISIASTAIGCSQVRN